MVRLLLRDIDYMLTQAYRVFRPSFAGLVKSTLKSVRLPLFLRWCTSDSTYEVLPVVEAEETKIPDGEGNEVTVPVNIADPNPNGVEFDNLYLDMNGIVSVLARWRLKTRSTF